MGVQRVLRDVRSQPSVTFMVGSTPTAPDAGASVTITRGDGTVFTTDGPTTAGGPGEFTYTLGPQSNLELFTLRWRATFAGTVQYITTQVEIVGGYYVSLADLKAEPGMSTKTDAQLAEGRQWFEELAEAWCGIAFVPRYARDVVDGTGTSRLLLTHRRPRTLYTAKVGGVAETFTDWALYDTGMIARPGAFTFGRLNYELTYEHGYAEADGELREATLTAVRSQVAGGGGTASGIPSGVTQLATDAGVMTFGRPSRPTGIASVDTILNNRRVALVA
jgi:hypothetical protein